VLGSVTIQGTTGTPPKRYANVLTLNTAGSNLLLFSCPSTPALISWAAVLRLAPWEKSRLEEIYTAHIIRIVIGSKQFFRSCLVCIYIYLGTARATPTTLVRGKMEGWAGIRIAGQTDWKRVWISVQEGTESNDKPVPADTLASPNATMKKKRGTLFSLDFGARNDLPPKPVIAMFASPRPKDRKKPIMTVWDVTQAFGVYPERPELISRSTMIKVEGTFGDDDIAANLRLREGWVLIMPEIEGTEQTTEMLKWIIGEFLNSFLRFPCLLSVCRVALHDAFDLYGRPDAWTWDPLDPTSLMFGYPVGPLRDVC
jgi:CCR4-NOT transcriptional complex subunit CAF120